MDANSLDHALLNAHANHDIAELVRLYTLAGDSAADTDAACFYLTHAFVFALESGLDEAKTLNKRLADQGRAQLLMF